MNAEVAQRTDRGQVDSTEQTNGEGQRNSVVEQKRTRRRNVTGVFFAVRGDYIFLDGRKAACLHAPKPICRVSI